MLPTGHPAPASGPVLNDRLHDDAPVPPTEAASTSAQRPPTPASLQSPAVLLDLLAGTWSGRTVQVAVELGIADLLAAGPRSVSDLARSTDTDVGSLHRLLRALASLGVFDALDAEHYANNDVSTCLRADAGGAF